MAKTVIEGSAEMVDAALTTIIAGVTPNIQVIVEARKGYWIIIHVA